MRTLLALSGFVLLLSAAAGARTPADALPAASDLSEKRTAAARGAPVVPGVKYASQGGPQLPAQHYVQQQQQQQLLQQQQQQQYLQQQREQYVQAQQAGLPEQQQTYYLQQAYQPQYNVHYSSAAQQPQLPRLQVQQQQQLVQVQQPQQRYQFVQRGAQSVTAAPQPAAAAAPAAATAVVAQPVQYLGAQPAVQYVQQPQYVNTAAAPAPPQAYTTGYLVPGPNGQPLLMVPVASGPGGPHTAYVTAADPQGAPQQYVYYQQQPLTAAPSPAAHAAPAAPVAAQAAAPTTYYFPQQQQLQQQAPAALTYTLQQNPQQAGPYYQLQQEQPAQAQAHSHQSLRHADRATSHVTRLVQHQQQ